MAIQDSGQVVSFGPGQAQEKVEPWWVNGWYWPGAVLGLVAGILFAISPWMEQTAKFCGTGVTVVAVGALITVLYGFKSAWYDEREKAISKARSDALSEWRSEQEYEHCKEHCHCLACRTQRDNIQRAKAQALNR